MKSPFFYQSKKYQEEAITRGRQAKTRNEQEFKLVCLQYKILPDELERLI